MRRDMNSRSRSFDELESFDGNWVISSSRPQQLYDNPKSNKQLRIPTGHTVRAKSQGYLSERWAGSTATSKEAHVESNLKRDGKRGRSDYTTRRLKSNNRRNHSTERPSTNTTSSSGYNSSSEIFRRPSPREVILHQSNGGFGFSMRQIPSSLYGRKSVSAFRPTAKVPALQRLNYIDPESLADRAGLKPGDYIIEVNHECVTCAPHQYVVHLIKSSPDALKLKVVEGAEDVVRAHYHANVSQRNNAARFAPTGETYSSSYIPLRPGREPPYNKRSNGIPLQQLKPGAVRSKQSPTTILTPHQTSNSHSATVKHSPPISKATEPVVANIRLSRMADHDQIYYESGQKQKKTPNTNSQSMPAISSVGRIPSFTSMIIEKSEPQTHDSCQRSIISEVISERNHQTVSTGSVQEELGAGNGGEEAVTWSGSSTDDANHTYDKIRPVDVPFDTDEGYIRLSGNVDYIAQVDTEQDQVDFLAMAEKARQMYLRSKSISQTQ